MPSGYPPSHQRLQPRSQAGSSGRASLVIVGYAATFIDDLKKLRAEVTVIKASDLDLDVAGG